MQPLVLIPRNGIGNRFRAISSALALSEFLKRELLVLWEPRNGCATRPSDLFSPDSTINFLSEQTALGRRVLQDGPPLYLRISEEIITLRGHDRGEQMFIKDFVRHAQQNPETTLVIAAGNFFHPKAASGQALPSLLRPYRRSLLDRLVFKDEILERAAVLRPPSKYIGLHLRGTDRKKEAPTPARLLTQCIRVANRFGIASVFLCSDEVLLKTEAERRLAAEGLQVFTDGHPPSRGDTEGELHAVADLVNLSQASFLVGSRESTFATEASVRLQPTQVFLRGTRRFGIRPIDRILRHRLPNFFP